MNWIDNLLPFAWWQRVLIVLAVLLLSPLLLAAGRLALAVGRLVWRTLGLVGQQISETVAIPIRALLRMHSPSAALLGRCRCSRCKRVAELVERPLQEVLDEYVEKVRTGRVVPLDDYLERCRALVRRGLSRDIARRLGETSDAELLRQLEACTDAQLAELSRTVDFVEGALDHKTVPWQWPMVARAMGKKR